MINYFLVEYSNTFLLLFVFYEIYNLYSKFLDFLIDDNYNSGKKVVNDSNKKIYNYNFEEENEYDEYSDNDNDNDNEENNNKFSKKDLDIIKKYSLDLRKSMSILISENIDYFADKRSSCIFKYNINKHIDEYFKTEKFLVKAGYYNSTT